MSSLITIIVSIIASIFYGVLLIVVISPKPRTQLRKAFSIYLLAMLIWSISAFLVVSGFVSVLPWFRLMSAAGIISAISIFYFVETLFSRRLRWTPIVLWYGIFAFFITVLTNSLAEIAYLDETGELVYELNPMIAFVAVPGYLLLFFSLGQLISKYRQVENAAQRNRFRYLILAILLIIIGTLNNFTELGRYPFDIAANGISAILIAYAILRHQLLDIRLVIRTGLLYTVTTAILGTAYYLSISVVILIFQPEQQGDVLFVSLIIAIIFALLFDPLRNLAQTWIDRIFYREKYNASLMLQRLSQMTATILDLEKISNLILSEVVDTLQIESAALFVKKHEVGDYQALEQLGINQEITQDIKKDHPIATWLAEHKQVLNRQTLDISPLFKSIWGEEKTILDHIGAELYIPLIAKDDLVGVLAVGRKRSKESFTKDDQLTLTTLSNQTAVAVENARLYKELEDTFEQTVVALANAIDVRDTYTSDHSQQIATWAAETSKLLGCSPAEIETIYWGGLLHDIGKIGIPDSILLKPTTLTESEWDIIIQHPKLGAEMISPIKKLSHIAPIVEYSHERYDGSGYPYGVTNDEIPLGARIVSVVDSFSAMMDERPYKKPMTLIAAVEEIKQNSGILYDPDVVTAFFQMLNLPEY
ncbi:HD domain-containing phosphohydrolase [Chloroflexota bacterium]